MSDNRQDLLDLLKKLIDHNAELAKNIANILKSQSIDTLPDKVFKPEGSCVGSSSVFSYQTLKDFQAQYGIARKIPSETITPAFDWKAEETEIKNDASVVASPNPSPEYKTHMGWNYGPCPKDDQWHWVSLPGYTLTPLFADSHDGWLIPDEETYNSNDIICWRLIISPQKPEPLPKEAELDA